MPYTRRPASELTPPNNGAKHPNISVRMPIPLIDALGRVAEQNGRTRNQIIRDCVLRGLKENYGVEVLLENSKPLPPKRNISLNE